MAVNTNKSDININTDELYDIREGTLINYYGSDTTVTLPESIKSISSDAFGSDKALIKKIIIGKNVQYIDDNAFQGMCELESVSVDPENNYYVSSENYLAAKDGSTIFLFDTNSLDSQIFNFADKVGSDIFCKDGFEIVFKDAVLYFSESPDISLGTASCILDHIDAYGKTIYLETSLQGDHNINIQFFNSGLLITDYSYGIGDTFILSYDGMWEQHTFANLDENNCNDSVVNFYTNENGELIFVCMPRKYLYNGTTGDLLMYSSSKNEIYSIKGKVVFKNDSPWYEVEEVCLLSDKYSDEYLNREFNMLYDFFDGQYEPVSQHMNLETLFENNKAKYGMFEWDGLKGERLT